MHMPGPPARASRRQFLKLLGACALGGLVTAWLLRSRLWNAVAQLVAVARQRTNPTLVRTAPGTLSAEALQALEAVTLTLVDTPVEMSHYASYFRWRSDNLSGYRDLYEDSARRLDEAASRAAGRAFSRCDRDVRMRILERVDLNRSGIRTVAMNLYDRGWIRFEQYVVREILALFVRTDGWVLLGYESWPGTPRGLDGYTKPPRARRNAA